MRACACTHTHTEGPRKERNEEWGRVNKGGKTISVFEITCIVYRGEFLTVLKAWKNWTWQCHSRRNSNLVNIIVTLKLFKSFAVIIMPWPTIMIHSWSDLRMRQSSCRIGAEFRNFYFEFWGTTLFKTPKVIIKELAQSCSCSIISNNILFPDNS